VKETMTVGDQNWNLVLWQKEPEGDITFLASSVLVLGFALSLVLGSLVLSTKAEHGFMRRCWRFLISLEHRRT
jgi:hypothetical protein